MIQKKPKECTRNKSSHSFGFYYALHCDHGLLNVRNYADTFASSRPWPDVCTAFLQYICNFTVMARRMYCIFAVHGHLHGHGPTYVMHFCSTWASSRPWPAVCTAFMQYMGIFTAMAGRMYCIYAVHGHLHGHGRTYVLHFCSTSASSRSWPDVCTAFLQYMGIFTAMAGRMYCIYAVHGHLHGHGPPYVLHLCST